MAGAWGHSSYNMLHNYVNCVVNYSYATAHILLITQTFSELSLWQQHCLLRWQHAFREYDHHAGDGDYECGTFFSRWTWIQFVGQKPLILFCVTRWPALVGSWLGSHHVASPITGAMTACFFVGTRVTQEGWGGSQGQGVGNKLKRICMRDYYQNFFTDNFRNSKKI